MRLLNIQRSDYWDSRRNGMVTIYSNLNKAQFEDITHDLRELGYNLITFGNKMRELETDTHLVVLERG